MGVFHISSCWVKIRLHTRNELPVLPVSALTVSVWWGGGSVGGGVGLVGSTALCDHTNIIFGLKFGCDKKYQK